MSDTRLSAVALVALVVVTISITVAVQPPAVFAYFAGFICLVAAILGYKAYQQDTSRDGGDDGV
jgi:hypothetical protein